MKCVVVSGINIDSAGPLSVLRDCLRATVPFADRFRFVVLVHDRRLFDDSPAHLEFMEFPLSKRRWAYRLWYEYVHFRKLSRSLRPFLWFSMHDVTPNVQAERRAVYCHNSTPFYRLRLSDVWLEPTLGAFRLFYGRLYGVNIQRNDTVIVQQEWMRGEFRRRYRLREVVVAHPGIPDLEATASLPETDVFVYPCFPRVFKNVELVCRAFETLEGTAAKIVLTIDGTENRYAKKMKRRFGHLTTVEFAGRKSREEVFELYLRARALVFPSLLESWGMPLSEFRGTGKPILAADLPYAHEALAGYEQAYFFDPHDPGDLARQLRDLVESGSLPAPEKTGEPVAPEEPFAADWSGLWRRLLSASDVGEDATGVAVPLGAEGSRANGDDPW